MRVAALYDIHGNLPALEAVLQEVAGLGLDAVVCGGDVFPGPMGCECLHALQALDIPVHFVMGNGDREVLAARSGVVSDKLPSAFRDVMAWCAAQRSDADATAYPQAATFADENILQPPTEAAMLTALSPRT